MFYSNEILADISALTSSLSYEENQELLHCSRKMRNHLQRQVIQGNTKYEKNIDLLDMIIENHVNRSLGSIAAMNFPLAS